MKYTLALVFSVGLVFAQTKPLQIVADGDSRTVGYWYSLGPLSYPSQLGLMLRLPLSATWNLGVVGARTSAILNGTHLQTADSLGGDATHANVYVLWAGGNDFLGLVPASVIESNIAQIVAGRKAAGFSKVIVLTEPPEAYASAPPSYEPERRALNQWLLSGASGAIVCDIASNPALQHPEDRIVTVDGIHYTTTSYWAIALQLASLIEKL